VTVVLAAICVVGQLSSVAHLVQVGHVTCAEHGELVHAEERAPDPALSSPASDAALPAVAPVSAPPPAHGHEHCLVAGLRRDSCVVQESEVAAVAAGERQVVRLEWAAARVAPFALFRLAPKNSPPA
jgi:hypothetical protein